MTVCGRDLLTHRVHVNKRLCGSLRISSGELTSMVSPSAMLGCPQLAERHEPESIAQ